MSKRIGIQLGEDGDLLIQSGSMSIGDTLYQNQYIILKSHKGEVRHFPTLGVGIEDMANDDDIAAWKKTIRDDFSKDGLTISTLSISSDSMTLEADYK